MVLCYGNPRKQIKDAYSRLSSTRQGQGLAEDVAGKKTTNPFKIQTGYHLHRQCKEGQPKVPAPCGPSAGWHQNEGGNRSLKPECWGTCCWGASCLLEPGRRWEVSHDSLLGKRGTSEKCPCGSSSKSPALSCTERITRRSTKIHIHCGSSTACMASVATCRVTRVPPRALLLQRHLIGADSEVSGRGAQSLSCTEAQ